MVLLSLESLRTSCVSAPFLWGFAVIAHRIRGHFAAVLRAAMSRKLVNFRTNNNTYKQYASPCQHRLALAQVCVIRHKAAAPQLCVCFGVAMLRRYRLTLSLRKCLKGDGEDNRPREHPSCAVRLQTVFRRARQTNQAAPQGERANATRANRSAWFPFDPDTTAGEGHGNLRPHAAAYRSDLSGALGRSCCRSWESSGRRRVALRNVEVVALAAPFARRVRRSIQRVRGKFGIYYLSAVSGRVCDTPCILFFWKKVCR